MIEHTPEWLKGLAAFITAIGGAFAVLFKFKKKPASSGLHSQSFQKEVRLNTAADIEINTLQASLPNCNIVSISHWRNGKDPKEFRLKRSTDFNTWSVWKDWVIPEDSLIKVQAATLTEGVCHFFPDQLKEMETRDWYSGNGIKQTLSILIGVNDLTSESLVLYINFTENDILINEHRKLIRLYVNQLHELYKPEGWLAKKNYLK